jgi:hypothetical protein
VESERISSRESRRKRVQPGVESCEISIFLKATRRPFVNQSPGAKPDFFSLAFAVFMLKAFGGGERRENEKKFSISLSGREKSRVNMKSFQAILCSDLLLFEVNWVQDRVSMCIDCERKTGQPAGL